MSVLFYPESIRILGSDANGNNVMLCEMAVDDIANLPAANAFISDGYVLSMGCKAIVINDNSVHRLNSAGQWVQIAAGTSTYTRAEIDTITLSLQNQIDSKTSINGIFGERETLRNVDLNNITIPDKYVSGGSATTTTLTNCPATSAFIMFVDTVASPYRIIQRIYEYDTITAAIKFFIRAYISSGWGAWYTAQLTAI